MILRVDAHADLAQIKAAYHRAAKANHPDLFPEEQRSKRQRAMMKINEAYMGLVHRRLSGGTDEFGAADGRTAASEFAADYARPSGATNGPGATGAATPAGAAAGESRQPGSAVGFHRDAAYVYYKRGFVEYTAGVTALYRKDPREIRRQLRDMRSYDGHILKLSMLALQQFSRAYDYFSRVVGEYPDSIWVNDARAKLYRLERYNAIYQRICDNLSANLVRLAREQRAAGAADTACGPGAAGAAGGPGATTAEAPNRP